MKVYNQKNRYCLFLTPVFFVIFFAQVLYAESACAPMDGTDYSTAMNYYSGFYNAPQHPNRSAFAALTSDGSIVAWGDPNAGGSGAPAGNGYEKIFSTESAFAALTSDGSIVAWGDPNAGGSGAPAGNGYEKIFSTESAFAALTSDGSIVAWGDPNAGGSGAPAGNGYEKIFSTESAFAAYNSDGSVTVWGDNTTGGNQVDAPNIAGYENIFATQRAFAAFRSANGRIIAWGDAAAGGSGEPTYYRFYDTIASTSSAFVAKTTYGFLYAWGDSGAGGTGVSSGTNHEQIFATQSAFAVLRGNGSIVVWGDNNAGGNQADAPTGNGYEQIFATESAFAALRSDGSIAVWGDDDTGGNQSDAPNDTGYVHIVSTQRAFAALKYDGSIVAWGDPNAGGSGAPAGNGYEKIFSTESAFAALTSDGSIVAWGDPNAGGSGAPADAVSVPYGVECEDRGPQLVPDTIDENQPPNTVVGELQGTGSNGSHSLNTGCKNGGIDNHFFTITGKTVSMNISPDYETKDTYYICIRSRECIGIVDPECTVYIKQSIIRVNDLPDNTPLSLSLAPDNVDENVAPGTRVGVLTTNTGGSPTYTLTTGCGNNGVDNDAFTINGDVLFFNESPDYEVKQTYNICITVDDGVSTSEEEMVVRVNDINNAPTNIALTDYAIADKAPQNTKIGTFTTQDDGEQNPEEYLYTLNCATRGKDDAHFAITNDALYTRTVLTYNHPVDDNADNRYNICVRVSEKNGGLTYDKNFTITVSQQQSNTTGLHKPHKLEALCSQKHKTAFLTWKDKSHNEKGIKIQRKTDNGPWETIKKTKGENRKNFTDTNLINGHTYHYRIRMYTKKDHTKWSNVASCTFEEPAVKFNWVSPRTGPLYPIAIAQDPVDVSANTMSQERKSHSQPTEINTNASCVGWHWIVWVICIGIATLLIIFISSPLALLSAPIVIIIWYIFDTCHRFWWVPIAMIVCAIIGKTGQYMYEKATQKDKEAVEKQN